MQDVKVIQVTIKQNVCYLINPSSHCQQKANQVMDET